MIHLDTSFLIHALVGGSAEDKRLRVWIKQREPIGISAIAWAEFACGPVSPGVFEAAARLLGEPVGFTGLEADLAARLFNESGRRRGSMVDCMIAATALQSGHRLATANPKDFLRFAELGLTLAS